MSAASGTRIFGVRLGIDPKFLVGGILVLAALLFWYNSRGDDEETSTTANAVHHVAPTATAMPKSHIAAIRRGTVSADRGTLRLRPVDATRGDVDPTLRLDLLERLQSLDEVPTGRSLFDIGPSPAQVAAMAAQIHGPTIVPKQTAPPPAIVASGPPPLNIPLKFYGYVKPGDQRETCRGFFMDGDNVLVATEGEVLKQKYRVLALSAKSARLEDIQLKQQQTLPVEPEAVAQ
jgi:hypothetical protein